MSKPKKGVDKAFTKVRAFYGGTFDPPHYGHLYPLLAAADALALPHIELLPAHVPVFKNEASLVQHRLAMTELLASLDSRLSVNTIELERSEPSYTVKTFAQLSKEAPDDKFIFIIGSDSLTHIHKWRDWRKLFDYCHLLVLLRPEVQVNSKGENRQNIPSEQSTLLSSIPENKTLALNLYDFQTTSLLFDNLLRSKMDDKSKAYLLSKIAQADIAEQNSRNDCCMDIAFTDIIANSASGKLWLVNNQQIAVSSTFVRMQLEQGENVENWVPHNILEYIKQHHLYL